MCLHGHKVVWLDDAAAVLTVAMILCHSIALYIMAVPIPLGWPENAARIVTMAPNAKCQTMVLRLWLAD